MTDKNFYRPYSEHSSLSGCTCGAHGSQQEHDLQAERERLARGRDSEALSRDFVEAAAVRALFPHDATRRRFLKAVGMGTAMAAIASVLPLQSLQAMAEEKGPLEKKNLKIGFIPINCATPLIMADPMGFYREQGLNVSLQKTAGWALVRDNMLNGELDASHFLAPMPLAISMGLGSSAQPMRVATIQNTNGQAITLALKHKDNRDPHNWKGFKFAIPFEFSMHNFLLRYYLAEHGLDPDRDVQLRVTPPAEMIANLRAGNIDGFLGPDPFNQRAVYDGIGFIHILSKDIWDGHPCCSFGTSQAFIEQNPNTFAALYRAILNAATAANDPANLPAISQAISTPNYLNQPEIVIRQALTGRYADGLGKVQNEPDRAGFDAMPWYSMATWMLTQMKRWGYVKGEMNFSALAEQVFLMTDARRQMASLAMSEANAEPASGYKSFSVMGRPFDPRQPQAYLDGFAIKRS
ncbi:nitrate ABC transporter substrate-binding protein [Stutzerimonas stutzeri]|mgnify:CR=1 FL=1|jgi:nitrate/nitrite transport system substrate-binding protein|uniref:ABC transporter substrate-binding protein n=1 Tax=Stutzerimonas stutzeri subgroup TaxID=578833 RepID=UPI000627ED46|nr:ABC transporter substrate-binding protein [Stutzerimonas kunmingensis]KKJ93692.1 nitrate ABC transporter substrate-binding protein [Stutzerimonas stutzeri]MBD3876047.1 ABC transporter substrate-binding protein [Stutzerimonas kunmingensis]NCT81186.1 ABC transporter substrate-binding protein [Stutzerimonas stutzeri]|tara:strand:- start:1313 stop:2707 length:1395 start_codon:yes stop_codon:yes gene_type:complete